MHSSDLATLQTMDDDDGGGGNNNYTALKLSFNCTNERHKGNLLLSNVCSISISSTIFFSFRAALQSHLTAHHPPSVRAEN